jgi:hypothetical protein
VDGERLLAGTRCSPAQRNRDHRRGFVSRAGGSVVRSGSGVLSCVTRVSLVRPSLSMASWECAWGTSVGGGLHDGRGCGGRPAVMCHE